jgi:hypothetical protein
MRFTLGGWPLRDSVSPVYGILCGIYPSFHCDLQRFFLANEKVGRISGKRVEISEWTIYLLLERGGGQVLQHSIFIFTMTNA